MERWDTAMSASQTSHIFPRVANAANRPVTSGISEGPFPQPSKLSAPTPAPMLELSSGNVVCAVHRLRPWSLA